MILTVCDWHLAVAAHAYEAGHTPIMSDMTYDILSRTAAKRGTQLPGFADYTGSWVDLMDREVLEAIRVEALTDNNGRQDVHPPAIRRALDKLGLDYMCCLEPHENRTCWEYIPVLRRKSDETVL